MKKRYVGYLIIISGFFFLAVFERNVGAETMRERLRRDREERYKADTQVEKLGGGVKNTGTATKQQKNKARSVSREDLASSLKTDPAVLNRKVIGYRSQL